MIHLVSLHFLVWVCTSISFRAGRRISTLPLFNRILHPSTFDRRCGAAAVEVEGGERARSAPARPFLPSMVQGGMEEGRKEGRREKVPGRQTVFQIL